VRERGNGRGRRPCLTYIGDVRSGAARDQRIAELGTQIDELEGENSTYQEQVLKAYQKIKTDEATVARAKKALAIALTTLDDTPKPQS